MVTGLYASLAASASVFIGILTAILASKVSNLRTERSQIEHRIRTIDARLDSLDDQRQDLEDQIEGILRMWEHEEYIQDARERVSDFIENHVGDGFTGDPDSVTLNEVKQEFADFDGIDRVDIEANEFLEDEMENRFEEIKQELGRGRLSMNAEADIQPDANAVATHQQTRAQQKIHQREEYNRYQNRWDQTKTELQSLKTERDGLTDRYDSLDASPITRTLWVGVITIGLSVVVPSLAYLFRIAGIPASKFPLVTDETPFFVEPALIFVIWIIGLGAIFYHLNCELSEDIQALPDEPDIRLEELESPGSREI